MRVLALILLLFCSLNLIGQTISESDIKKLATELNQELKGLETDTGGRIRGCFSVGRTLTYQYDMPSYWEPPNNIKEELIANFKTAGNAKTFFLNDIGVDFHYYKGSSLIKKVSVKSNEFSTYNFELGEYLSIKNHLKSKNVNLKLKAPKGWDVEEGDRPNIVKKFVKDGNTYLILIKDNGTFFSRSESREIFGDESFVDEIVEDMGSHYKNLEVSDKSIVTIDTYPSVTFQLKGKIDRTGITIPFISRWWVVLYEDKFVLLQTFIIDNAEARVFDKLFSLITNSVIFPDQYN